MLIRAAKNSDRAALALTYQAAFSSPPFTEQWTLALSQRRVSQIMAQPHVRGWVATVFGQPVGFAFVHTREGFNGPYGELMESAVHPYFREQGIGTALAKAVRAFQKQKKLKVIYTLAYRGMFDRFYRKTGFKPSRRSLVYVWK
jgi:ribosomal protein S18 acetylase RimI-like enzyme